MDTSPIIRISETLNNEKTLLIDNPPPGTTIIGLSDNIVNRLFKREEERAEVKNEPLPQKQLPDYVDNDGSDLLLLSRMKQMEKYDVKMKEQEQYWQNRLNTLKESVIQNEKAYENSLKESEMAAIKFLDDNHKKLMNSQLESIRHQLKESSDNVKQCFKDNARMPLLCMTAVEHFNDLIRKKQNSILSSISTNF